MQNYPFVITISSEKGGVGKTTLATNLAIFLKALKEDLPVTVFSFDNHFTIDRMFELPGHKTSGTVADLLKGVPGGELLNTGQYGVSYIPSSNELTDLRTTLNGPMVLARMMAESQIPGVVIIDTRPELDILTQNALYAADQAYIPVKDMASLENCKNIFALFDSRGLDKKSLALLPCLIDSRIKFDGMFRDQRTLLKAFAINRGYRCLDSFISKSPKVDSLNTNPEGKIFAVLTHARGTEVYGQFAGIARNLLAVITSIGEPRSVQFSKWLKSEEERRNAAYASRRATLNPHCPICGSLQPLPGTTAEKTHFYENLDGSARGFIHQDCFTSLSMSLLNPAGGSAPDTDPFRQLLIETTTSATFIIKLLRNGSSAGIEFTVINSDGKKLISRFFALGEYSDNSAHRLGRSLYSLMENALGQKAIDLDEGILLVQPAYIGGAEAVLKEDEYRKFRRLKQLMLGDQRNR